MSENRGKDDPQSAAAQDGVGVVSEVGQNQPGSKGDGSSDRAGQGSPVGDDSADEPLVRSRDQKPNPSQTSTEATMTPGGDLGHKRTTL